MLVFILMVKLCELGRLDGGSLLCSCMLVRLCVSVLLVSDSWLLMFCFDIVKLSEFCVVVVVLGVVFVSMLKLL